MAEMGRIHVTQDQLNRKQFRHRAVSNKADREADSEGAGEGHRGGVPCRSGCLLEGAVSIKDEIPDRREGRHTREAVDVTEGSGGGVEPLGWVADEGCGRVDEQGDNGLSIMEDCEYIVVNTIKFPVIQV